MTDIISIEVGAYYCVVQEDLINIGMVFQEGDYRVIFIVS